MEALPRSVSFHTDFNNFIPSCEGVPMLWGSQCILFLKSFYAFSVRIRVGVWVEGNKEGVNKGRGKSKISERKSILTSTYLVMLKGEIKQINDLTILSDHLSLLSIPLDLLVFLLSIFSIPYFGSSYKTFPFSKSFLR